MLRRGLALPRRSVDRLLRGMATSVPSHERYVWQEPPGRVRQILDLQRFAEQRWKFLRLKYLEKLVEMSRRTRLSNNAWQPRLEQLEAQYQHLAYGLGQVAEQVARLGAEYGVKPPAVPRRKFNFDRFDAYVVGGLKYDHAAAKRWEKHDAEDSGPPETSAAPLLRPEVYGKADRRAKREERRKK
jgi:hypothetical protein